MIWRPRKQPYNNHHDDDNDDDDLLMMICLYYTPPLFWNFSENSSILETPPFPKDEVNCFVNQHQSGTEKLQQYGYSGQIFPQ